jgi:hypothetical protein
MPSINPYEYVILLSVAGKVATNVLPVNILTLPVPGTTACGKLSAILLLFTTWFVAPLVGEIVVAVKLTVFHLMVVVFNTPGYKSPQSAVLIIFAEIWQ